MRLIEWVDEEGKKGIQECRKLAIPGSDSISFLVEESARGCIRYFLFRVMVSPK